MFTKEHYKRIASIIGEDNNPHFITILTEEVKMYLFNEFCKMFEEDNPLFDKSKFADACGM